MHHPVNLCCRHHGIHVFLFPSPPLRPNRGLSIDEGPGPAARQPCENHSAWCPGRFPRTQKAVMAFCVGVLLYVLQPSSSPALPADRAKSRRNPRIQTWVRNASAQNPLVLDFRSQSPPTCALDVARKNPRCRRQYGSLRTRCRPLYPLDVGTQTRPISVFFPALDIEPAGPDIISYSHKTGLTLFPV